MWCALLLVDYKQLLDEAEHNIKNYPDRGQCCLPKLKGKTEDIERVQDNS